MFKKMELSTPITIESVELALQMIPHEAFADNLEPLMKMANRFLEHLEPSREFLVKQNFQVLKPLLLSIHQIFVVMARVISNSLDENQPLYQRVANRLSEVKMKQSYYPIYYLTSLVKESFRRVEKKEPLTPLMEAFRKGISEVKPVLYVSSFLSETFRPSLKALDAAIKDAERVIKPEGTWKSEWYDEISHLNLLGVKCLLDEASFDEFCSEVENLLKTNPARLSYSESVKAVRYSVLKEFQHLATVSKSEKIRDRCLEWILDVVEKCEPNGFASDTDIFEALLDALASTHSSVNPAQKEAIKASIEKMADTKSKRLKDCYSS